MATGPWTDELATPFNIPAKRPLLRLTKGTHLVFPREKLPLERAITLISPVDGRVMFAIPWRGRLVLGTTDTDFQGSADSVVTDAADARYLCDSANKFFPKADFHPRDAIATWAGLRPLVRASGQSASAVSREHQITMLDDGTVLIAGGKLTTYRLMAKEIVDKAVTWLRDHDRTFREKPLRSGGTKRRPLPGAAGLSSSEWAAVERLSEELAATYSLARDVASHLAWTYGVRAHLLAKSIQTAPALGGPLQSDLPYVWAEIVFAVTHDLARTLEDVLGRRVPLALVGLDQGLDVAAQVAEKIAPLLGWDALRLQQEIARYSAAIDETRRFHAAEHERASG